MASPSSSAHRSASTSSADRPSRQSVERGIERRPVRRHPAGTEELDEIAVEAPLEIRLAGEPLATTMRTPGDDSALALGFLYAEGVIGAATDLATIAPCGDPRDEGYGNVIDATPGPGVVLDPDLLLSSRRGTLVTAACGVCGRASIDDLMERMPARVHRPAIDLAMLRGATDALAGGQPAFRRTGAMHAAVALDGAGARLAAAEDVGRHNAVDKVLGRLLGEGHIGREANPPAPTILVVSGRTSFEIVQKAAMGGFAAVVAVSGPTTLAIDLARRAGLVLAGFVRDGSMNIYTP